MSYNTRTFQKASFTPLGASRPSRTRGKLERDEGKANKAALLANFSPREAFKAGSLTVTKAQNPSASAEADRLPATPSENERANDVVSDKRRASRGRLAKKALPYVAATAIAGLGIYEAARAAGSEESSAAKQAAPIEKHLGEQPPTPPTRP